MSDQSERVGEEKEREKETEKGSERERERKKDSGGNSMKGVGKNE